MMHASFLLGGVRAVGTTGNCRYLQIVAAVTLLSSVPSLVSFFLSLALSNGTLLNTLLSGGMFFVTACSAYAAQQALRYVGMTVSKHSHQHRSIGMKNETDNSPAWQASNEWAALFSVPSRMHDMKETFIARPVQILFRAGWPEHVRLGTS